MKCLLNYIFTTNYTAHRNDLYNFWEEIHGHKNKTFFDSFYSGNPLGNPLLGLCYNGNRLIGQENYLLQNVSYAGDLYFGAMGIDTLVDPEYRLFHGVFGKLCRLTIDEISQCCDMLFAYANEESKQYYLKYFGWKITAKLGIYKKIVKTSGINAESLLAFIRPGKHYKDLKLDLVSNFPSKILMPLIEKYRLTSPHVYFYKSSDFLNWKFLNNVHYQTNGYLITSGGFVYGYCVTYNAGIECNVLDILVDENNPELFIKTILSLSHIAKEQGMQRIVIYATPDAWYKPLLSRMVFIKRGEVDFITRFFNKDLPQSGWIVHRGDFDIF